MSLLTKKDVENMEGKLTTESAGFIPDAAVDKKKVNKSFIESFGGEVWCLSFAPQRGESNCSFFHKGETIQFTLVDGCHLVPKDLENKDRPEYIEMLIKAGFVQSNTTPQQTKGEIAEDNKLWKYMHPDHSEDEPINTKFMIKTKEGEEEVDVVNSVVSTKSKAVAKALGKKGFVFIKVEDIVAKE